MSQKKIIVDGLKAGKTKNQILTDLIRGDASMDLVAAGKLYHEVGTAEGLIMSAEDKEKKINEIAAKHVAEGKLNREAATTELMQSAALSKGAATSRLKNYCEVNKVEFPAATRTKRDMEAVKTAYKAWWDDNVAREQIEAGLVQHFGYGEKSVGQAYIKIGRELGLIDEAGAQGRIELAAWFANADNVTKTENGQTVAKDKKDVVEKLMADTGVAKATAETRYGMYLFAVEFHKALTTPPAAAA